MKSVWAWPIVGVAAVVLASAACGGGTPAKNGPASGASASAAAPATASGRDGSTALTSARAGGPSATGLARRASACSLISRDAMAAILGSAIGTPHAEETAATTSCRYPPGTPASFAQATVTIEWEHTGGKTFEEQLLGAAGAGGAIGHQVAHEVKLGDSASFSRTGVLTARAGHTLITVDLPLRADSEEKAIAIGRKILDGLGVSVAATTAATRSADAPLNSPPPGGATTAPAGASESVSTAGLKLPEGVSLGPECPDLGLDAQAEVASQGTGRIPLKVGLTLSHLWRANRGDYDHECLTQVIEVDDRRVTLTQSCLHGEDRHTATIHVCRAALRDAHVYHPSWGGSLPTTIQGTTEFSVSERSFAELKSTGQMRHEYLDISARSRPPSRVLTLYSRLDLDGVLKFKDPNQHSPYALDVFNTLDVIVNDRKLPLPILNAWGNLRGDTGDEQIRAKVLDDARFPIVLEYEQVAAHFTIKYTKISFPDQIEQSLATEKHVDVYGIYFDFNSDVLRPESEPVLREIAAALKKNADWALEIQGHTDSVGVDDFNLNLSRRRSAAVRSALTDRFGIAADRLSTSGFGASRPKETNETVEGRARNRRVELVRR